MSLNPNRVSEHGYPKRLEGYAPFSLGIDAVPVLMKRLRPRKAMLMAAGDDFLVSGGLLHGYDDVTVSAMPAGGDFYGGYWDGHFANLTELRAWMAHVAPKADLLTVTPSGANGSMAGDFEPGCMDLSKAVAYFRNRDHGNATQPILYSSASWGTDLVKTLRRAGIADNSWIWWSAHYTGTPHFCGPHTCGFGLKTASMTQYATGRVDANIAVPSVFKSRIAPPAPKPPVPSQQIFSMVQGVSVVAVGDDSVTVKFSAPAKGPVVGGKQLGVSYYEIAITPGPKLAGRPVGSWPRHDPKGTNPEVYTGGGLKPGTLYSFGVRAVAVVNGKPGHAGKWVTGKFTTTRPS